MTGLIELPRPGSLRQARRVTAASAKPFSGIHNGSASIDTIASPKARNSSERVRVDLSSRIVLLANLLLRLLNKIEAAYTHQQR